MFDPASTGRLSVGDRSTDALVAERRWCDDRAESCSEEHNPLVDPDDFVPVAVGSGLNLRGSAESVLGTICDLQFECAPPQDLEQTYGIGLWPGETGRYIFRIDAGWRLDGVSGEADLYFGIEMVDGHLADDQTAPTVAEVACTAEGVDVQTPTVAVQRDGLHLRVSGEGTPARRVEFLYGATPEIALDFEESDRLDSTTVLIARPGVVQVRCVTDADSSTETPEASMEILDPGGFWQSDVPECSSTDHLDGANGYSFPTRTNAVASGIEGSVPGILPGDEVSRASFPGVSDQAPRWRIVRDGHVVAILDLSNYGDQTFVVGLSACAESGIGQRDAASSEMLATPYHIDGYTACDPYGATCSTVYVSAAWYAQRAGVAAEGLVSPAEPWMACSDQQPEGCPPDLDTAILELRMSPAGAERFVAAEECGDNRDDACRIA